jgi:hypothetical protein
MDIWQSTYDESPWVFEVPNWRRTNNCELSNQINLFIPARMSDQVSLHLHLRLTRSVKPWISINLLRHSTETLQLAKNHQNSTAVSRHDFFQRSILYMRQRAQDRESQARTLSGTSGVTWKTRRRPNKTPQSSNTWARPHLKYVTLQLIRLQSSYFPWHVHYIPHLRVSQLPSHAHMFSPQISLPHPHCQCFSFGSDRRCFHFW